MKTTTTRLLFLSSFILVTLTACAGGDGSAPLALSTVTPEAGSVPGDSKVMTLIEATTLQGVPQPVAAEAMAKYDQFKGHVRNHGYMSIIDFTQQSGHMRYFLVNTTTGKVDAIPVAHGSGSDPSATGTPKYFSNRPNSRMSSLGAYIVNERSPSSKHGTVLRVDGLESTNSNARARALLIHSAAYVVTGQAKQGMSWGCAAIPLNWIHTVIDRLADGSYMYAYGMNHTNALAQDMDFLQGAAINPAAEALADDGAPVEGEW